MLPVVQIVLILEAEKSSLERFDLRVRPASLSAPWYGAGDEGSLLFANFRSCSVQRRHFGHERKPLWRRLSLVRMQHRAVHLASALSWPCCFAPPLLEQTLVQSCEPGSFVRSRGIPSR